MSAIREFDALDTNTRIKPWQYYDWLYSSFLGKPYKLPHEENFYFVYQYEDVARVLMDTETFSSQIYHDREIPFFPMMSGSEHHRIRGVLQSLFTPGSIQELTPRIEKIALYHTQRLLQECRGDIVSIWTSKIPLNVIAEIVGHPADLESLDRLRAQATALNTEAFPVGGTGERSPKHKSLIEQAAESLRSLQAAPYVAQILWHLGYSGAIEISRYIGSSKTPPDCPRQAVSQGDRAERLRLITHFLATIAKLFKHHIQARKDSDEILHRFVQSHLQGNISLVEMMMAVLIILLAGYGTTSSLLSCAVYRLGLDKELFLTLKQEPERIGNFVDELLRFYGPLQRTARRATREVTIGGITLPKNAQIILLLGAANCDPKKFKDPQQFNHARLDANKHIAFGRGPHVCLGAALARQEVHIALRTLLAQAHSIQLLDQPPPQYIVHRDTGMYGFESLHVDIQ
jgi:cytochrome P450